MPRPPLPILAAAAVLVLVVIAVASLGGDDTVRSERPALRLTVDEYTITPQDVSVPPGRMKFIVRNTGRLTHNLVVEIEPDETDEPAIELGGLETMQPGETADPIKLTLRPGEYQLRCTIANHDDLGQYGTLTVEE
jgi:hypothetical protein